MTIRTTRHATRSHRVSVGLWAVIASSALLLVACGSSSSSSTSTTSSGSKSSGGTYNIGGEISLTGASGPVGVPQMAGLRAAIAGINKRGGVNGHQINLIIRDDQSNPSTAVSDFTELTSADNVSAVAGLIASLVIPPLAPLAKAKNVALLTTAAPSSYLNPPYASVFSTSANLDSQGIAGLGYFHQLVQKGTLPANPRIAALYYSSPAGQQWIQAVSAYAKKQYGWTFVAEQNSPVSAPSLSTQMTAIAAAHPDALLMFDTQADAVDAAKAGIAAGLSPKIYAADYAFASTPSAIEAVAAAGLQNFAASANFKNVGQGSSAVLKDFAADTKAAGVNPSQIQVPEGYAQGLIIQNTLAKCGYPCDSAAFEKQLQKTDTDLGGFAFGPVIYTPTDHEGVTAMQFVQAKPSGTGTQFTGNPVKLVFGQ